MRQREDPLDARQSVLRVVIGEAADAARRFFTGSVEIQMKGPQDFLTAADGAVERVIIERLRARNWRCRRSGR
jgi:fructose-1,6-bisphosphatase/inositol monophosphatase family enzyme